MYCPTVKNTYICCGVYAPFINSVLMLLCSCLVWMQQTYVHAVVVDPEVVFVANQTCAQAPSLVASFQCDCHLKSDGSLLSLSSNIKDLQLLACPFIHKKEDKAVSTVRSENTATTTLLIIDSHSVLIILFQCCN